MKARYFLCPECGKLCKKGELLEYWSELTVYTYNPKTGQEEGEHYAGGEFEYSLCVYCKKPIYEKANNLIVEVDEKEKTIKPIGEYWKGEYEIEGLKKFAKKLGYKPVVEVEIELL